MLAGVILGLLSLEGLPKPGMSASQIISQALAAQAGFVLLVQALLDQQKEQAVQVTLLPCVTLSLPWCRSLRCYIKGAHPHADKKASPDNFALQFLQHHAVAR